MSHELDPVAGNWYRNVDRGQTFRVVDVDEDDGTITVQHSDGELEEMDDDAWFELDLELAEEPEDWVGPVDAERDDLGFAENDVEEERDWVSPRSAKDDDWDDDDEDDDRDDWNEDDDSYD